MTGKGAFGNEGFVPVFSYADRCAAIKLAGTYHLISVIKNAEEFYMANTTKTAVEIEWLLDTPVRDDIYQYLIG